MATTKYRLSVSANELELLISGIDSLIKHDGKSADKFKLLGYLHGFTEKVSNGSVSPSYVITRPINVCLRTSNDINSLIKFLCEWGNIDITDADSTFCYISNNKIELPDYLDGMLQSALIGIDLCPFKDSDYSDSDRELAHKWLVDNGYAKYSKIGKPIDYIDIIDDLNL